MLRCVPYRFASVVSSGDCVAPQQSQRRAAAHENVSFYDGSSVTMPKPVTRPTTKHNDPALNPGLTVQSPAPGGTQSSTPPGLPSKLDDDATVVAPDAPGSATPKRVGGSAHTDSSNGAGAPRGDELKALLAQHAAGLLATAVDALPGLLAQYLDRLPTGEQVTAPRGAWSKPPSAGGKQPSAPRTEVLAPSQSNLLMRPS